MGNLVLLQDHPEGCNKIQDKYKSKKFVVVGKHPEPNVYCIKPVNDNGPELDSQSTPASRSWRDPE